MHPALRKSFAAPLLAIALLLPALSPRAQDSGTHTRPRRVGPATTTTTAGDTANSQEQTVRRLEPVTAHHDEAAKAEPIVRVGLTTAARSANISTTGRLLYAVLPSKTLAPLESASLRVEPHAPPAPTFSDDARRAAETADARRDDSEETAPANAHDAAASREDGLNAASASQTTDAAAPTSREATRRRLRLASRVSAPARGAALYLPGKPEPLEDHAAPVVFASDDDEKSPLRFNDKPYRGRIEVFTNTRGALTVVNVLGLEDYVRGVVANELSPGGWPELEALKAQAVAARTYAVSNAGRFRAEGFDLLPTTRSQVYGGRATEHPLTDRAVAETRGVVATFNGAPINALYTSTCGGRTENAEEIFGGDRVPYLRSRECNADAHSTLSSFVIRSTRALPAVRAPEHATSVGDYALLEVHGFPLPQRLDDDWLSAPVAESDARKWLERVAALARQTPHSSSDDATRPAEFASALLHALDGESRASALLNRADVDYILSFRDAASVPERHRAEVALLLREGHMQLYPDATLRPRQPLARARALRLLVRSLSARGLLRLNNGTARPSASGSLIVKPASGKSANLTLAVAPDAFLIRAFGESTYQTGEVSIVGGEAVAYHTNARGEVDYLEVRPAASGASSDRFSPFANWSVVLTPELVRSRLGRSAAGVGALTDLRVRRRGASGRVLELEIVGALGTTTISGGRIRSALGLREQLFVIARERDEEGRVTRFKFDGRGWGHGVGMCQVGAYGLAREGRSYEAILKSYYTGISLTRLY